MNYNETNNTWSQKLGQFRHDGISVILGFQNAGKAPIELTGNCDALIFFQSVDARDRYAIKRTANLSHDQTELIGILNPGQCVLSLSRCDDCKYPVFGIVEELPHQPPSNEEMELGSKEFLKDFHWETLSQEASLDNKVSEQTQDNQAQTFLKDVLNQKHEFSGLTERFQRTGIRSATKQGNVIRELIQDKYIQIYELAIGRGRPIKLVEPKEKAFQEFGISWEKTPGILPTRAATEFLYRKLSQLPEWKWTREGKLGDKQIDLLGRNKDGEVITGEIAHSTGHEVHNAKHCLGFSEVKKHVVVATSKKALEEVKRAFEKWPDLAEDKRIEALVLSQALSDKWIP